KSSEYAEKRAACMQLFRDAALRYIQTLPELEQEDEETEAFEFWYYASLGAVDLGRISEKSKPDLTQPAMIRETIQSIPGDAADRHLGMFANSLFTRMSSLKPEMKFRYLRTGFEIVGDHKQAAEAKKVFDYYKDLVTEIRLETRVDGSTNVGHAQPFGLFVDLVHTTQIERESGGFGKYLQNQNNMYYSYNYGRPTENYRDKFEEAATEALKERFEVLSVTFNDPEVTSSATSEFGWRKTPYAYVLLKPRGPEVDMIPSLHIDLDFLDTSGYAIIPVESASIPIDAKSAAGEERPFENLKVVQTLDERQAKDGKLILEVKATSHGLLPDLEKLVQMDLEKFDVQNIDDQGLSVDRFDPDAAQIAVSTERTWLITMRSKPELKTAPDSFQFPSVIPSIQEVSYQRYVDADLEEVESSVRLKASYDAPNRWWFVPLIAGSVLGLLAILLAAFLLRKKTSVAQQQGLQLPDVVTPFTVLGLLKQIEAKNGFNDAKRIDLARSIQQIEQHYFVNESTEPLQLEEIASHWLQQSA
ncbi:MAG: hypothetical protein KDA87_17420, partial [Planctomycetales bacterium]|nr:hypothetical protein [Planctomycetales bacterium]